MMTTPNTMRSYTDTIDSRSEGNYRDEYELISAEPFDSYEPQRFDKISMSNRDKQKDCVVCKTSNVPICHIKLGQLENLKNSTKKLLCLLEDVQAKTHSTALVSDEPPKMADVLRPMANWDPDNSDMMDRSVTDIIGSAAIQRLEKQTQELDSIVITDKDDDCSVYKRLIRKCHCLNQQEYNDFIIHFNEDTKFCTNTIGEIIKNILILKKFLYVGGTYTRNALLFLNQGLEESTYTEKAEITQACAFADLCCIFDTFTIVTICISWPCSNPNTVETDSQEITAKLLYNLSRLEEGRRYLNLNAKITRDIKKLLKKKQDKISCDTVDMLNQVLNSCEPQIQQGMNTLTYHCRPMQEGIGNKTLNALIAYRQHMTLNELFMHLDILQNLSSNEETKLQLTPLLPSILTLFRNMLLELNNSDVNIMITNIMTNIVGDSVAKKHEKEKAIIATGERITSCIATEPIQKKNVTIQVPAGNSVKKKSHKKGHRHRQNHNNVVTIINNQKKDTEVTKERKLIDYQHINRSRRLNPIRDPIKPKTAPATHDDNENTNNYIYQKGNSLIANFALLQKTTKDVFQREYSFINNARKLIGRGRNYYLRQLRLQLHRGWRCVEQKRSV